MIASLGMYDPPALHGANDRFWSAIRHSLGHGPKTLTRDRDALEIWQSPDLLLAQTCGMPFRTFLHPRVTLIGTPAHDLPGPAPGYYHSVLVARGDSPATTPAEFTGTRFAYNQDHSQSGWAGPMIHLDRMGVRFGAFLATGSHAASALAVARGGADLAGLDVLTWQLLREHDPALAARLRVIGTTAPTPALPYVTAAGRDPAPIGAAIRAAIAGLSDRDRRALHLTGLVDIPASDYLAVATPPGPHER